MKPTLIIPLGKEFLASLLLVDGIDDVPKVTKRFYKETATGRIRIIKTPAGEAPEEIRQKWVGLELPCEPIAGSNALVQEYGTVSGKNDARRRITVSVPQDLALLVLAQRFPEVVEYWTGVGYPRRGEHFGFGFDEVELIDGVTVNRISAYEDAGQGGERLSGDGRLDR